MPEKEIPRTEEAFEKCCLCKKRLGEHEQIEKMGLMGYSHEECAAAWNSDHTNE